MGTNIILVALSHSIVEESEAYLHKAIFPRPYNEKVM